MDRIDKDEELVCPLCGGRLFGMPVFLIYACEHCKQSYSEINGVYMRKKRESTAEESSAVGDAAQKRERGDCAKLREALKAIVGLCAGLMPTWDGAIGRIKDIAEAALAAPPRNCDVYTADELKAIFKSELVSQLPIANEHEKNLITITATGVIDTLLAPATEKEGGGR